MAQFRGIGDAATQVIQQQKDRDMRAAQLSEQARQFDINAANERAKEAEQARRFDTNVGLNREQAAEQARRFDVNTSVGREQAAEQARQFDVDTARQQAEFSRQQGIDDFNMQLDALTASTDLAAKDADTQMKLATLNEYVTAQREEERRIKNRDNMARTAIGGLVTATILNGGVPPVAALSLASKQLGAEDGSQIAGGLTDPDTDEIIFNVVGKDGAQSEIRVPFERQLPIIEWIGGKPLVDSFASRYKNNAARQAEIRKFETSREIARQKALSSESASVAKRLTEMETKGLAGTQEYGDLQKRAKTYTAELDKSLGLGGEQPVVDPKEKLAQLSDDGRKVKEDVRKRFNLPPDAEARVNPSTGEVFVSFMKNGQRVSYILTE